MTDRSPRSDALSNRIRIVEAARTLIDSTATLRLNAVAKAAGVGQGTLYRHFPTREALLIELYRTDVELLVTAAHDLLARYDAVAAVSLWFDRVAEYARIKHGVLAALEPAAGHLLTAGSASSIVDAVTMMLDAGKSEGAIRDDIDAGDVLLLLGFLSRLEGPDAAEEAARGLRILLNGLRTRP